MIPKRAAAFALLCAILAPAGCAALPGVALSAPPAPVTPAPPPAARGGGVVCDLPPASGPMPAWLRKGSTFWGRVVRVVDGDTFCVAVPGHVVDVRLFGYYAPERYQPGGKAATANLAALAMGQTVACEVQGRSFRRVVADCRLTGVPLRDVLARSGVIQGGRGFPGVSK